MEMGGEAVTTDYPEVLARQISMMGLPEPTREFIFHSLRKWRFDLAWPALKLAVEVDGGIWTQGRHTRGAGYEKDCEKFAEAGLLGWRVYRFPVEWVTNGRALAYIVKEFEMED